MIVIGKYVISNWADLAIYEHNLLTMSKKEKQIAIKHREDCIFVIVDKKLPKKLRDLITEKGRIIRRAAGNL